MKGRRNFQAMNRNSNLLTYENDPLSNKSCSLLFKRYSNEVVDLGNKNGVSPGK